MGWPVGAAEIVFFYFGENHKRRNRITKNLVIICDFL